MAASMGGTMMQSGSRCGVRTRRQQQVHASSSSHASSFSRPAAAAPAALSPAPRRAAAAAHRRAPAPLRAVSAPKVLVRPPGQRQFEWVDLWESYTLNKVVFIREALTEELANNMIALTLYLDSLDQKRIYYWLNCPGGEVVPTLALYDTMQYVRSKTATVCYGMCLGMGGFLLTAGGEKGYRYAMPHSILMMHHPSGASRGQASEMHLESRELVRMRDYLSLVTADATGQPYDRVIRELSRNKWMDPREAIEYGMIDKVLTTPLPKAPAPPPGGKFTFARSDGGAQSSFDGL